MSAEQFSYPDPHYAPGWQEARARVEPLAIWALVTGVLLLGPVALVLAILALRRIAVARTRGRGLAIAGLVLGALGTLAAIALVTVAVLTSLATRSLPADVSAARDAHSRQLVTGNCLAELGADGSVDTVRVVPCADPHTAQVVTTYEFADDAIWPGQTNADARVGRACVLDQAEIDAGVGSVTWAPTAESWKQGDRTGLCLAVVDGGGVTGSFLDDSATLP